MGFFNKDFQRSDASLVSFDKVNFEPVHANRSTGITAHNKQYGSLYAGYALTFAPDSTSNYKDVVLITNNGDKPDCFLAEDSIVGSDENAGYLDGGDDGFPPCRVYLRKVGEMFRLPIKLLAGNVNAGDLLEPLAIGGYQTTQTFSLACFRALEPATADTSSTLHMEVITV